MQYNTKWKYTLLYSDNITQNTEAYCIKNKNKNKKWTELHYTVKGGGGRGGSWVLDYTCVKIGTRPQPPHPKAAKRLNHMQRRMLGLTFELDADARIDLWTKCSRTQSQACIKAS